MTHPQHQMKHLLIFGEIFWDEFQNGEMRMGGSALNIAWHLRGLGQKPRFISRIGDDGLGKRIIHNMKNWDLSTSDLQVDPSRTTGVVKVLLDEDSKPTFISPENAALDYIQFDSKFESVEKDSIFYHGTFILRNEASRSTVRKFKDQGFSIFMDFNLRDPYWNQKIIDEWVRDIHVFKLSDDESIHLTKIEDLSGREQIEWLQDWMPTKNIQNVLFTLGDKGSFWINQDNVQFEPARKINVVNSVGAGDAYVAGILYSEMRGIPIDKAMKYSSLLASEICKIEGATSTDPDFYKSFPEEI